MTKLNYVRRKSEGPKLGAIVAKDLTKRRKSLDAKKEHSLVELHLEGKKLTDEGLTEAARSLAEALTTVDSDSLSTTRLSILNLNGNLLTSLSLAELAPVVQLAAADLQEIDLSYNDICVADQQDARNFSAFFEALAECSALRKINLSNNNLSGVKPWEILTRTYLTQFGLNLTRWDTKTTDDRVSDTQEEEDIPPISDLQISTKDYAINEDSTDESDKSQHVRGIPSVAVLSLCNTQLDDSGAIFLSVVLERQRWVQNQVCGRIWASRGVGAGEASLIYLPNERLGTLGMKLLSLTEDTPYHPDATSVSENFIVGKYDKALHRRRSSGVNSPEDDYEHFSHVNKTTPNGSQTSIEEVKSLRRRLQASLMSEHGVHAVELWSIALKALSLCRSLPQPESESIRDSNRTSDNLQERSPHSNGNGHLNGNDQLHGALHNGATHMDHQQVSSKIKDVAGCSTPRPLTVKILQRVVKHAVDGDGVLNESQLETITSWGTDRNTLASTYAFRSKAESAQKVWVLTKLGCLNYEDSA